MYSFKYNQQDATLYNILYYCQCFTCFRRFLRPLSGAQNCIHSIWFMSSLLAATASGSSKQAWYKRDSPTVLIPIEHITECNMAKDCNLEIHIKFQSKILDSVCAKFWCIFSFNFVRTFGDDFYKLDPVSFLTRRGWKPVGITLCKRMAWASCGSAPLGKLRFTHLVHSRTS
jgi:hypothetical protein